MTDKTLPSRERGSPFVISPSGQTLLAPKGFNNPSSRCPNCREA